MSKYGAVYFVGDNQANNRIRVDSYKTRNRGAFSGSLAALVVIFVLKLYIFYNLSVLSAIFTANRKYQ